LIWLAAESQGKQIQKESNTTHYITVIAVGIGNANGQVLGIRKAE
jgi:hypothetical protein